MRLCATGAGFALAPQQNAGLACGARKIKARGGRDRLPRMTEVAMPPIDLPMLYFITIALTAKTGSSEGDPFEKGRRRISTCRQSLQEENPR